ncbi:MAG: hypothetical protein M0Z36_04525 [Thermaerobacter sp.]|nr:hypothetical protein [Thermaerobacter sp.]
MPAATPIARRDATYYDGRDRAENVQWAVCQLKKLGYWRTAQPASPEDPGPPLQTGYRGVPG